MLEDACAVGNNKHFFCTSVLILDSEINFENIFIHIA